MLSVIKLNIIILNVVMLSVIMLNVIMLNVAILNVVRLSVVMKSVAVPIKHCYLGLIALLCDFLECTEFQNVRLLNFLTDGSFL